MTQHAGRVRAMRWALTSEPVPAREMLAAGVVAEVVADADLQAATSTWLARLAVGPTLAHAAHKRMLNYWVNGGIEAADALLPELAEQLMQTVDARRGIASVQDALRRGVERPILNFEGK